MDISGCDGVDVGAALAQFMADFYAGALPPFMGTFVCYTHTWPGDVVSSSPVRVVWGATFDAMVMPPPTAR